MLKDQDLDQVLDQLKDLEKIAKLLESNIDWSELNVSIKWQEEIGNSYINHFLIDILYELEDLIEILEKESKERTQLDNKKSQQQNIEKTT